MIKYAKIINDEKGLCEVGAGSDTEFYKSLGMIPLDVCQSEIDAQWYLSEKCPTFSDSEKLEKAKKAKIAEINQAKEKAFKEGIIFNGAHFDCDDRAQDRTGNRMLLLQALPVETLEWLDYDYKPVEMNTQEFQQLCAAIFERVQFIEFQTGLLLSEVEKAVSVLDIDKIKINFTQTTDTQKEAADVNRLS